MKKKNSTPRRKRMNKLSRLHAAQQWIRSYNGKNLIRGYAKWFGVDQRCAINELKILGIPISETLEKQVTDSINGQIDQKRKGLQAVLQFDPIYLDYGYEEC